MSCQHDQTEPVVVLGETVALVCVVCTEALPPEFGCPDCQWATAPRRLCDPSTHTEPILTRACKEHTE